MAPHPQNQQTMKTFTFKKLIKWCFAVFWAIIIVWGIYVHFKMPVNVETLSKVAQHHEDVFNLR